MKVIESGEHQITLYFGNQTLNGKSYYHDGIDIVRKNNRLDIIVAAEKGKVIKVVANVKGRNVTKGYGNYVELQHNDNIITRYCHLKYGSIKVKVGQIVQKAQKLGDMGDTGYTFGAHLHFQVMQNGKTIEPLLFLKDAKQITPYSTNKYVRGNYGVIVDVLNVRKGPSINHPIVRYPELTNNAKEQMAKLINYFVNGYVKGIEFTAIDIMETSDEAWAKTPSGWVCLYNNIGTYCAKLE